MCKRWWLSFCDPSRPAGTQFRGVAIVDAPNLAFAIHEAWALGVNPGGEVLAWEVEGIPDEFVGRLLSKEELLQHGLIDGGTPS